MPDEFSFTISGIEETCEMLTQAPRLIAKNAFARAGAAAARPIVEALEAHTPSRSSLFDEESWTRLYGTGSDGTLLGHIVTDVALDAEGRGVKVQVGYGNRGFVARMVEYGHRMFSHYASKVLVFNKGGRKKYRKSGGHVDLDKPVAAHPFMRPAAAESGEAAVEQFTDSLRESMAAGIPGVPTNAKAA